MHNFSISAEKDLDDLDNHLSEVFLPAPNKRSSVFHPKNTISQTLVRVTRPTSPCALVVLKQMGGRKTK